MPQSFMLFPMVYRLLGICIWKELPAISYSNFISYIFLQNLAERDSPTPLS